MESRHDVPRLVDADEPRIFSSYSTGLTNARTPRQTRVRRPKFPPIDEHLVVPEETTEEIIKGRRVKIMPSEEEHAETDAIRYLAYSRKSRPFVIG